MHQGSKKNILFNLLVFFALLIILPIIVYQVQRPQEIRTRAQVVREDAALIASFNTKLFQLNDQHGKAKTVREKEPILKEMTQFSTDRRKSMLALMKEDPSKANELALSQDEKASLPKDIHSLVEESIETEGTLEVLHIDDFDEPDKSTFQFFLNAKDGKRYNLHLSSVSKGLVSGTKVSLKGIALEENIAAAPEEDGGLVVISEPQIAQASVTKNTAVILVNFQDDTSQPWTTSQGENSLTLQGEILQS